MGLVSGFDGLERLPLAHQVTDLPHQVPVPGNNRLGFSPVVVEPGGRHPCFKLLDGLFALPDPGLEVGNPTLPLVGIPTPAPVGRL